MSKGTPFPFGAFETSDGINFAIYAKEVDKISLYLFHEKDLTKPLYMVTLKPEENRTGDVWHCLIKDLPSSFVYEYLISKKNDSSHPQHILDPYAKSLFSNHSWDDEANSHVSYKPLSKFTKNTPFDWEHDSPPNIPLSHLIIYEMHVRGYTKDPSSQVKYPGTYRGIIEKIAHLKDLGINAVELMPIHEFNENGSLQTNPENKQKLHNYFGYSTTNFFTPMNRFASHSDDIDAITEFKMMVKELHKNGIEVILDVVFNHTYEGNENGSNHCFRALDASAYYMINGEGGYLNFSGCGNTFNCNHPVSIEFIITALRYWVIEMHVDGFRFDLASIFNRAADGTPIQNAPIVEAISKDPILASIKLIAEPWDAGGLYQVGSFFPSSQRWLEWNGKYRDVVRRFLKGTPDQKKTFVEAISGSKDLYGLGKTPTVSINFITAHDGFSLEDLVSYNEKHNNMNGEENRDGLNDNDSWNCGAEGETEDQAILDLRNRQMRNLMVALMISQGIPMILMGDEYAHSKNGNNNTWCQDNQLNWFLWNQLKEKGDFYRFYRLMIHFRKSHPILNRDTFWNENDIKWHGVNPDQPEWELENQLIAFSLYSEGQPDLYIAFNASGNELVFNLPSPGEDNHWKWIINTNNPAPLDFYDDKKSKIVKQNHVTLARYSCIVLKATYVKGNLDKLTHQTMLKN